MNFERIDDKTQEVEDYDAEQMYAFLNAKYSKRTANLIMEQFKSGRKKQFYDHHAIFQIKEHSDECRCADCESSRIDRAWSDFKESTPNYMDVMERAQ